MSWKTGLQIYMYACILLWKGKGWEDMEGENIETVLSIVSDMIV